MNANTHTHTQHDDLKSLFSLGNGSMIKKPASNITVYCVESQDI
jgi:hypothetical protein